MTVKLTVLVSPSLLWMMILPARFNCHRQHQCYSSKEILSHNAPPNQQWTQSPTANHLFIDKQKTGNTLENTVKARKTLDFHVSFVLRRRKTGASVNGYYLQWERGSWRGRQTVRKITHMWEKQRYRSLRFGRRPWGLIEGKGEIDSERERKILRNERVINLNKEHRLTREIEEHIERKT